MNARTDAMRQRLLHALQAAGWLLGAQGCGATVAQNPGADATPRADAVVDATAPDATAPDAPLPDVAPPDASVVDTAVVDALPACNTMTTERCMTDDEARQNILFPPGKMTAPPDGGHVEVLAMATREPNGCYAARYITNDCCNRARSVTVTTGRCCYVFCNEACCGRPLRVDGHARVASLQRDARSATVQTAPARDDGTVRALAAAWRDDGRMEHAAIASFARFALQLLALGAPADLVRAALAAADDEIEHARLCFTLAARCDGEALVAGALPEAAAAVEVSLAAVAASTAAEGCVRETCAALVAAAQRDVAVEPEAVAALTRIARDEASHAELAWRFVAWALSTGGEDVRVAIAEAIEGAMTGASLGLRTVDAGVDVARWHAAGRLTATEERAHLDAALADVVRPVAAALLAATTRFSDACA